MDQSFLDQRQERVHRRLALAGRGPAAFFLDACRIMRSPKDYAAPTHLVGHSMREIESGVRDVFELIVDQGPAQRTHKRKGEDQHHFEISRILETIGIAESDDIAKLWLQFAGKESEQGLHRYAHRANLQVRPVDAAFEASWDAFLVVMDAVLGQLEDRFFVFINELDRLLAIAIPTEADVQRLEEFIVRNVTTERYFFERLSDPGWLAPLRKAKVFSSAWPLYWPASDFLRRMSPLAPSEVCLCMRETPLTVSFWTVADYLDACLALDINELDAWSREWLVPWILRQEQVGWHLPEKLQTLVLRLSGTGQHDTALSITKAALSQPAADAASRLETHDFEDFLGAVMPVLTSALPDATLQLSLEIFLAAVRIGGAERAQFDTIWRPSIEHEEIYSDQLLNAAFSLVRDTTVRLLTADPSRTTEIVDLLLKSNVQVLRRLAWYLLSLFGAHARERVRDVLLDSDRLREGFDYGEFGRALRANAALLGDLDQAVVFSVLAEGPDIRAYVESRRRWRQSETTAADIADYVARWRLRFLRQLEAILPEPLREEYAQLVAHFGAAADEEEHGGISVSWGTPSPRSSSQFAQLSTDDIVAFLRSWTPGEGLESREGLGDALRQCVKTFPARFSADAGAFMLEDAVYVSDFLGGIDEALENATDIAWEPLLTLCAFAIDHHEEPSPITRLESTWAWAHQRAAWLIAHAFDRDLLPDASAEAIFDILSRLLARPEARTPAFPAMSKPLAAVADAMNSVRGVAVDGCVSFAVWRHELGDADAVTRALELLRHVCEDGPKAATHAAIGRRLLALWTVDQQWLFSRRASLFPADEGLWAAAWAGYISRSRAYPDVFSAFNTEYERAVSALDANDIHEHNELSRALAQHLAMLYLAGSLPIDTDLLRTFFERAAGDIRGTFHWTCLRAVADNADKVSDGHWMRLGALWDERIAAAPRPDEQKELHWFGWLAALVPDSAEWLLRHLRHLIERGVDLRHDRDVLGRLAGEARTHARESFACVQALANADTDGRDINGWGNEVEQVLIAARDAADPALGHDVELFINRLASRGVLKFRHLLREQ